MLRRRTKVAIFFAIMLCQNEESWAKDNAGEATQIKNLQASTRKILLDPFCSPVENEKSGKGIALNSVRPAFDFHYDEKHGLIHGSSISNLAIHFADGASSYDPKDGWFDPLNTHLRDDQVGWQLNWETWTGIIVYEIQKRWAQKSTQEQEGKLHVNYRPGAGFDVKTGDDSPASALAKSLFEDLRPTYWMMPLTGGNEELEANRLSESITEQPGRKLLLERSSTAPNHKLVKVSFDVDLASNSRRVPNTESTIDRARAFATKGPDGKLCLVAARGPRDCPLNRYIPENKYVPESFFYCDQDFDRIRCDLAAGLTLKQSLDKVGGPRKQR